MQLKFVLPLCLLAYSASATISMDLEPFMAQQHHAMHLLVSRYSSQPLAAGADEIDFVGCFADYTNEQNGVVDVYQKSYTLCKGTASDARSKLTAESAAKRAELLNRGNNVCTQLSACEQHTDGLDFFQCYNTASSQSYPEIYTLSTESEAESNFLQIQYYQIANNEETCTTTSKNTYVASMAKCNTNFNDCLNGKSAPTTDEPTVTDAPVEPTTEEPIVTDAPVEPTTEEPIVTDAPVEPTTEEPIVTDAPVEPTTEEPIVTDAPVEPTTEEPIVTDAPVEHTTEEPIEHTTEEPIEHTTEEPIEHTTEEHVVPNMDLLPEEDLHLFKHQSHSSHLWNKLRRL